MKDRGMVKWNPFDSLISSKEVIKTISDSKTKFKRPTLSLEQLEEIQTNILLAYHSQITIIITYFLNGSFYEKKNKVLEIYMTSKKLFFQDHTYLYFDQIVKVQLSTSIKTF